MYHPKHMSNRPTFVSIFWQCVTLHFCFGPCLINFLNNIAHHIHSCLSLHYYLAVQSKPVSYCNANHYPSTLTRHFCECRIFILMLTWYQDVMPISTSVKVCHWHFVLPYIFLLIWALSRMSYVNPINKLAALLVYWWAKLLSSVTIKECEVLGIGSIELLGINFSQLNLQPRIFNEL